MTYMLPINLRKLLHSRIIAVILYTILQDTMARDHSQELWPVINQYWPYDLWFVLWVTIILLIIICANDLELHM